MIFPCLDCSFCCIASVAVGGYTLEVDVVLGEGEPHFI